MNADVFCAYVVDALENYGDIAISRVVSTFDEDDSIVVETSDGDNFVLTITRGEES